MPTEQTPEPSAPPRPSWRETPPRASIYSPAQLAQRWASQTPAPAAAPDAGLALLAAAGLTSPEKVQAALAASRARASGGGCGLFSLCTVKHVAHAVGSATVNGLTKLGNAERNGISAASNGVHKANGWVSTHTDCLLAFMDITEGFGLVVVGTPEDEVGLGEVLQWYGAATAIKGGYNVRTCYQ